MKAELNKEEYEEIRKVRKICEEKQIQLIFYPSGNIKFSIDIENEQE